jgi:hypothetical protein
MREMPNIWLDTLTTFDSAVQQVEICLSILKDNAKIADFTNPAIKQQYGNNVMYMKQLFEKAEALARGK